jgi:hypothetical protein
VDPGWIKLNGDRYKADTGRSEFVLSEVLAWEAAQPQDVTVGKVRLRTHADGSIEITRPIIMAASTNGTPAYGLVVTVDGDLVTYLDHASPRPSPEETQRRIAEAVANKGTAKAKALAEINGQLQARIENLERLLGLRP